MWFARLNRNEVGGESGGVEEGARGEDAESRLDRRFPTVRHPDWGQRRASSPGSMKDFGGACGRKVAKRFSGNDLVARLRVVQRGGTGGGVLLWHDDEVRCRTDMVWDGVRAARTSGEAGVAARARASRAVATLLRAGRANLGSGDHAARREYRLAKWWLGHWWGIKNEEVASVFLIWTRGIYL